MTAIDRAALRAAHRLATAQPRCDATLPQLPALPLPIASGDLIMIERVGVMYSVPALDFVPAAKAALTYDQVILATPGLVHYWPMNDPTGSIQVLDRKGGLHLPIVGTSIILGAPPVCNDRETTARWLGSGIGLPDPSTDPTSYIPFPASAIPTTTGEFTVEVILADSFNGNSQQSQIAVSLGPDGDAFYMNINGSSAYSVGGVAAADSTGVGTQQTSTAHFVITYDGTYVRGYINAWPLTTGTIAHYGAPIFPPVRSTCYFGGDTVYGYTGRIGKAALYSVALDWDTILHHYNSGVNQ